MARFDMRLDRQWRGPLLLIGATPARSFVELTDDALEVSFGRYREQIPRTNITGVARRTWPLIRGIGVRLASGHIAYVGSTQGVVEVELGEPQSFRLVFGWRMQRTSVVFSLQDPDGFVAALGVAGGQ